MRNFSITLCIAILCNILSCDGPPSFEEPSVPYGYESERKCSLKTEPECEKFFHHNCLWNVDRCDEKYKKSAPHVPENLGKVKMVAVGSGFCAIDMKNELWCIPRYRYAEGVIQILPHESRKFKHVAIAPGIDDKVCATKIDGTSVCFDKKSQEQKGPTVDKVDQTIPGPYHNTVCAFSATNLYCESDDKAFEKLGDFTNNPAVKNLVKVNLTDNPTLTGLAFRGNRWSAKGTENVLVSFSTGKVLWGEKDDTKAELWAPYQIGGSAYVFRNVISLSAFGRGLCVAHSITNGPYCIGGTYHNATDIPADINSAALSSIATTDEYTCVIVKANGELKCWGNTSKTKNIPKNLTGVKKVALGENMACIIDKDDMLQCFAEY